MSFWQDVQNVAGVGGWLHWLALGFVFVSLTLSAFFPAERRRINLATLFLLLSVAGFLITATLFRYGFNQTGAAYRWLRGATQFTLCAAIINLLSVAIFDALLGALKARPPRIMRDLLIAFAYVVVAITLLSRGGVDLTGIVATSAVITAVIGFSLQDTLGNVMGGMALQMERSITVGDWIKVDQQEGQVIEIRWRQTSIQTRNWDTVVIPNSALMKGQVVLLGRRIGAPRQHRQWVYFNVDFRFEPTAVIDAVEAALRAEPIPNIAAEPAPHCLVLDFKDSYVSYAARYWLTDLALTDPTDSVVRSRIYFALRRARIPLSIPAQTLFITEDDERRRSRKHGEEIERRVEKIRHVELFQSLTEEELRSLAERLREAPFVRGEAMTKQGSTAHWLYIITKGEGEVRVAVDGNLTRQVATIGEGDFFGEMGLMTGEKRLATVVALSDTLCYRLDKQEFQAILKRRPEIAEDISHVLARRRVELDAVREGLNEEAKLQRMSHAQGDILRRIRRFFTLTQ